MGRFSESASRELVPLLGALGHDLEISDRGAHFFELSDKSRPGSEGRPRITFDVTAPVNFTGSVGDAGEGSAGSEAIDAEPSE